MKTDDELIAEFMGMVQNPYKKNSFSEGDFYVFEDGEHLGVWKDAAFKYSWDWLMPVVEKIESMAPNRVVIDINEVRIISDRRFKVHTLKKINSVYQCVIQFIKWYNENKK